MSGFWQKRLACLLFVVYGGVALLGYGLHSLGAYSGAHRGFEIVQYVTHRALGGCCSTCHRRPLAPTPAGLSEGGSAIVTSTDCSMSRHACRICAFLLQARSLQPQIASAPWWSDVVPIASPAEYVFNALPTPRGLHTPRGPPLERG